MRLRAALFLLALLVSRGAAGQDPHAGMQHDLAGPEWTFMQDATIFLLFNDQRSPRGERQVKAPNWWMGMGQKRLGTGARPQLAVGGGYDS